MPGDLDHSSCDHDIDSRSTDSDSSCEYDSQPILEAMQAAINKRQSRFVKRSEAKEDTKTHQLKRIQALYRRYLDVVNNNEDDDEMLIGKVKLDLIQQAFAYVAALKQPAPAYALSSINQSQLDYDYHHYCREAKRYLDPRELEVCLPRNCYFTKRLGRKVERMLVRLIDKIDWIEACDQNTFDPGLDQLHEVHAVDADGCFLARGEGEPWPHTHESLVNWINQCSDKASSTTVVSFSARVSVQADEKMSAHHNNTDCFLDSGERKGALSKAFEERPRFAVNTHFLLSNVKDNQKVKDELGFGIGSIDEMKFLRTYQICHAFAKQLVRCTGEDDTPFKIYIYDDRSDILNDVLEFYQDNPQLLPTGCQLIGYKHDLGHQDTPFVDLSDWLMVSSNEVWGQGLMDQDYHKNLNQIIGRITRKSRAIEDREDRKVYCVKQVEEQLLKLLPSKLFKARCLADNAEKVSLKLQSQIDNQTIAHAQDYALKALEANSVKLLPQSWWRVDLVEQAFSDYAQKYSVDAGRDAVTHKVAGKYLADRHTFSASNRDDARLRDGEEEKSARVVMGI